MMSPITTYSIHNGFLLGASLCYLITLILSAGNFTERLGAIYSGSTDLTYVQEAGDGYANAITTLQDCSHVIYPVGDFFKCDIDNDHFEEFKINLGTLESRLIGSQKGLTITYHNPGGDLIDFTIGTQFVLNHRTVKARATDADGCFKETSFNLTLVSPPKAEIFANVTECTAYTLPPLDTDSSYFSGIGGSGHLLHAGNIITSSQAIFILAVRADCSDESTFTVTIDPSRCLEQEEDFTYDFPEFFTPNGDGINDFWKYTAVAEEPRTSLQSIDIFDRYGNLLAKLDPESNGWDGNSNGKPLPSSDYWFKAITLSKKEITGHFALKR